VTLSKLFLALAISTTAKSKEELALLTDVLA